MEYTVSNLRDPFGATAEPAAATEPQAASMEGIRLDGIVWSELEPRAIVNGRMVKVGSVLEDGVEVLGIDRNGVRLTDGEEERVLTLRGKEKR